MVELVYKLDEKSYRESLKSESIVKVRLKFIFWSTNIKTIHMDTNPITLPCSRCACGVNSYMLGRDVGRSKMDASLLANTDCGG